MRNLLQRRQSTAPVANTTTQASARPDPTTTTTITTTPASIDTPEMAERSGIVRRQRPPTVIVDIPSATLAWEEYEAQREMESLDITNATGAEETDQPETTTTQTIETTPSISDSRRVENRPPPLQLSRAPTYQSTTGPRESKPNPLQRSCFRYQKRYVGSAIAFVVILVTIGVFVILKTTAHLDFPGLLIIFLAALAVEIGIWFEVTFKITGRMDPEPIDDTDARLEWEYRNQEDEARPAANRDFTVQVDEVDGQQIVTSPTFPPPVADFISSPPSSPSLPTNRRSRISLLPSRARSRSRTSRLPPGVVAPWNRPDYHMELYTQRVPRLDGMGGDEAITVPLNRPPPPAYKARLRDGSRYVEAQTGLVRTLSQTQQRDRRVAGRLTLLEARRQPLTNDLERITSNTSVLSHITTQEQELPDEHIPFELEKNMAAILSALPPSPGSTDNTSTDV